MYILHPQWLAKREIIQRGIEVGIETNFTQPGFRFTVPQQEVVWVIAPNRLMVESHNPSIDCGTFVAKVLQALPETPLQAIGNNVHYEADLEELESLSSAIRDFPQKPSLHDDETVAQRTFHVGVKRGEHEITNLQLSVAETKLELSCNVHKSLEGHENFNAEAIAAAGRFLEDRARSKALAQHFFGTAVPQ